MLGLYDVDANASFCFDPACPLAEPDPNEFPAFESTLRLLNLPASTFKTRESVRLQHSDSENSGFHVCIFASNYLKTGRVGESTMSLEILRNFVLSTYQYVMEPAETKDLLTGKRAEVVRQMGQHFLRGLQIFAGFLWRSFVSTQ